MANAPGAPHIYKALKAIIGTFCRVPHCIQAIQASKQLEMDAAKPWTTVSWLGSSKRSYMRATQLVDSVWNTERCSGRSCRRCLDHPLDHPGITPAAATTSISTTTTSPELTQAAGLETAAQCTSWIRGRWGGWASPATPEVEWSALCNILLLTTTQSASSSVEPRAVTNVWMIMDLCPSLVSCVSLK